MNTSLNSIAISQGDGTMATKVSLSPLYLLTENSQQEGTPIMNTVSTFSFYGTLKEAYAKLRRETKRR